MQVSWKLLKSSHHRFTFSLDTIHESKIYLPLIISIPPPTINCKRPIYSEDCNIEINVKYPEDIQQKIYTSLVISDNITYSGDGDWLIVDLFFQELKIYLRQRFFNKTWKDMSQLCEAGTHLPYFWDVKSEMLGKLAFYSLIAGAELRLVPFIIPLGLLKSKEKVGGGLQTDKLVYNNHSMSLLVVLEGQPQQSEHQSVNCGQPSM